MLTPRLNFKVVVSPSEEVRTGINILYFLLQHSMVYFYHHYELPAILRQAAYQDQPTDLDDEAAAVAAAAAAAVTTGQLPRPAPGAQQQQQQQPQQPSENSAQSSVGVNNSAERYLSSSNGGNELRQRRVNNLQATTVGRSSNNEGEPRMENMGNIAVVPSEAALRSGNFTVSPDGFPTAYQIVENEGAGTSDGSPQQQQNGAEVRTDVRAESEEQLPGGTNIAVGARLSAGNDDDLPEANRASRSSRITSSLRGLLQTDNLVSSLASSFNVPPRVDAASVPPDGGISFGSMQFRRVIQGNFQFFL